MGTRFSITLTSLLLALVLILACGCTGGGPQDSLAGDSAGINEAIGELNNAAAPAGVAVSDWQLLTEELARVLEQKSEGRLASFVGDHPCGGVIEEQTLSWRHDLRGDYDNNGEVNISDLTPLAQHLHTDASNAVPGTMLWRIDGNMDGEINISDVTPIGANFRATAKAYEVLHSPSEETEGSVVQSFELGPESFGLTTAAPEYVFQLQSEGYYSVAQVNLKGQTRQVVESMPFSDPVVIIVDGVCGWVMDTDNQPIEGVSVSGAQGEQTTTNEMGYFELALDASQGTAVLSFRSIGYTDNLAEVPLFEGSMVECTVHLQAREHGGRINATTGGSFIAPDGSSFSIPAGALVSSAGEALAGELDIWLTTPAGSSGAAATAIPQVVETDTLIGALEIFINDGTGGHAQLKAGSTAEISMPLFAEAGEASGSAERLTFDMQSGEWVSERNLSINEGLLSGEISHLSWFGGLGPRSLDPEILVVRDDANTYDANYNAIIADLDELGALYTEVDFDENVVDTYVNGNYLAAIWYRGGQGDVAEPAQGTYLWDSADYELMFEIMENGGNVVLFSQQHTCANETFISPGFLHAYWNTEHLFNHATVSNADVNFGALEGQLEGFYIPELPILTESVTVFPNTDIHSSLLMHAASTALDAAEVHSTNGGSGLTPVTLDLPMNLPFISRGMALTYDFQSPALTGGMSFVGEDDRPVMSYGNTMAPGYDGLGTGRYYCIGYAWNAVSVDSAVDGGNDPASMERWDLLQNILSWLDNGLTFAP